MTTIADKAAYVRAAGQSRDHHCHWPGCDQRVPPAKWGCTWHWYALPKVLRDRIWRAFKPGQEVSKTPSREYLTVAREVQQWIRRFASAPPAGWVRCMWEFAVGPGVDVPALLVWLAGRLAEDMLEQHGTAPAAISYVCGPYKDRAFKMAAFARVAA